MTTFAGAAAVQIAGGTVRPGVFLRIDSDPPIRLWSGVGRFAVAADAIEIEGGDYDGFGEVIGLPALQQLINGLAERVEFALSGIDAEILALAAGDAASVEGRAVHLGLTVLDSDWQAISPMAWLWEGEADLLTTRRQGAGDEAERTVTLSVGSIFTGRRRPRPTFFIDSDQKAISPDDRFCERTGLTVTFAKAWPRY